MSAQTDDERSFEPVLDDEADGPVSVSTSGLKHNGFAHMEKLLLGRTKVGLFFLPPNHKKKINFLRRIRINKQKLSLEDYISRK